MNYKATKNKYITETFNLIFGPDGHMHRIITYDYTIEHGWGNSLDFEGLVAGAACGSWWSEHLDENNIPYAKCSDGSSRGFFQLNTKKEDYNYVFHSVNDPMSVSKYKNLKYKDIHLQEFVQIAHQWKVKLSESLLIGNQTVRVIARDSKGKLFNAFRAFQIDEK